MFYKKILVLTLICFLLPFASYAASKSKKATDDEMGSFEELAEKKANQAKVKKFKFACDGLVDFKWGDSFKSVAKKLKDQILEKDKESLVILSPNKDVEGALVFLFEDDKLNGASFVLTSDEKAKPADTVKEFVRISQYLNDMYGSQNCIQAESPRNLKKKAETYAKKLAAGEVDYADMWLVNNKKTLISHYIEKNEDYKKGSDEPMVTHALVVMDAAELEIEEIDAEEEDEEVEEKPVEKKKKEKSKEKDEHTTIKKYKGACIDLVPFKWGDSVDTVKKGVKWPLIEDTGNSLFYKGYYCKHTAEVEYIFENNKLTQVCYAFNVPNDKNEDYVNDYQNIGDYIYEKLGNLVYADLPDDFEDNKAKYAKQIMKGDIEFTMMYSFNDGATGVRHFMRKMTTDDGSKPDCPIDHFIGVWDNSKKNLHKDLEGSERQEGQGEYGGYTEEDLDAMVDEVLADDEDE